jgi:hypothetical protein
MEPETSLELGDGLETEDRMVMEPKDHLESKAASFLKPIRKDSDPNLVIDPPRTEGLGEPQPEAQNPLPSRGKPAHLDREH